MALDEFIGWVNFYSWHKTSTHELMFQFALLHAGLASSKDNPASVREFLPFDDEVIDALLAAAQVDTAAGGTAMESAVAQWLDAQPDPGD